MHTYDHVCIHSGRQAGRQTDCMHAQKERKKINRYNFLTLTSQCCTIDFPCCLCSCCLSFYLPNCGCACNKQIDVMTDRQTHRQAQTNVPLQLRGIKKSTKKEPKKQNNLKTKQTACTHLHTHARTYIHTYIQGPEFDPHIRHILSWRLCHEKFLRPFSLFRWFKKSNCQLLAKECALSTGKLPRRLAQEQFGYDNWPRSEWP